MLIREDGRGACAVARTGPGPSATRGSSFSGFLGLLSSFHARGAAVVGGVRADQGQRRRHDRAGLGGHVGDGVASEERAEEAHLPIIFALKSNHSRARRVPSSSTRARRDFQHAHPGPARLPRAAPATIRAPANTAARGVSGASLATCFTCARALYASGSAHEAHELVVPSAR